MLLLRYGAQMPLKPIGTTIKTETLDYNANDVSNIFYDSLISFAADIVWL